MEEKIKCEECKKEFYPEEIFELFGLCGFCERKRKDNYDAFVDPIGLYQ